jgi:site-specific recombinase XerD
MKLRRLEDSINTSTVVGKRNLAIIRLATRMGLRAGDIAKLRFSEINFSTGYISITQEKTDQPLPLLMPQAVSEALLAHIENITGLSKQDDGYLFHSMTAPYGRITTSIIGHVVTECFNTTGICTKGKKHGPHSFRSSLASSMVNDGGSYETVRRILGHTAPDAIKHYARTDIENLRLCSIAPPEPSGLFGEYLSGKRVIRHV